MEKVLAGNSVEVNEEGYLKDLNQWTPDIAREIAVAEEVELNDKCWEVISYIQEQYRNEVALSIRKIGKSGVVSIKEFYALFPNGPLKKASKISGIPKPVSCL